MAVGFPGQGAVKYSAAPVRDPVNAIFKDFYLPGVHDQLNHSTVLAYHLPRNTQDVSGKKAVCSLLVGRNEGGGYIAEQAFLPDPGAQLYATADYDMRNGYQRILFTGQVASSSRNRRGSFIRVVDAEIRNGARDRLHEDNRVMYGDGYGALAVVEVTNDGAGNIVVNNPGGFANPGPGTLYLRPGMRIGFWEGGVAPTGNFETNSVASEQGMKILSVDPSSNSITVDAGDGTADVAVGTAGSFITRVSYNGIGLAEYGSSGLLQEPFGLAAIIDEGNPQGGLIGNVDADTEGYWNAQVIDNQGTAIPFNRDMLQRAEDALFIGADVQVDMWITTVGVRRQYLNDLVANQEYVNTTKMDGGWTAVEYSGRPLVVDKDCTPGRIYGIHTDAIHMLYETDWAWMDQDGSILHRLPNQDAFQATLYRYWQLGTVARNRSVVIKDIATDS